jgi:ubiquinone/menaquinone biosynthesis C-methylase UbiE
MMLLVVRVLVAIVLIGWLFRQVRKPSGWLGKRVVRAMNLSHGAMTDWALQLITIPRVATILDIGCGGGRTIQELAAWAPEGKVFGLDYSPTSVEVSRNTNAHEIDAGRVQIEQGSVAALPFPDHSFDIVTAVETHYYWPDLPANVREVFRVVKPGGRFVLIAETYHGGPLRLLYGAIMPLLRAAYLSDEEHRNLLAEAGFTEVATQHKPGKNWILATGRRSQ